MAGIMAIIGDSRMGDPDFMDKLASVKGSLIIAGLVYVLFAGLIKIFGYEKVNKLLPPYRNRAYHHCNRAASEQHSHQQCILL